MTDIDTINLKGKDYATVASRLEALHEKYPDVSVETEYDFQEGWAICKATVTISSQEKNGTFNGHSMGKTDEEKAFEKLETVSVGRALANAGFLANGEVASAEEMDKFYGDDDKRKDDINNGDVDF